MAAAAGLGLIAAGCGGSSGTLALPKIGPAVGAAVVTPPPGAVVDAREWGTRDLALARKGRTATVSVVDKQGHGVTGLTVKIDGRRAAPCGPGCYRASVPAGPVTVSSGGRTWRFALPASPSSARPALAATMRAFAQLRSATLDERLASGPGFTLVTRYELVAPDRLRYSIRGGSQAIVIGAHRWDRPSPTDRWTRSPQQPVRVMDLPWQHATNAYMVAPHTFTFFDTFSRAWFRVVVDPQTSLPETVLMTGISHFMVDRYSRFDAPTAITPPRQ